MSKRIQRINPQFTFRSVIDSITGGIGGRKLLYISWEDKPDLFANVFYKRAYETSPTSIFEMLTNRSEKQLMDHVRPSLLMMQIRIALLSVKHQLT